MCRLIAYLITTAALISVSGSIQAQVPVKVAMERPQAAKNDQTRNEDKLRMANKGDASQIQSTPSPRNAAFIVFLSLVYGRK